MRDGYSLADIAAATGDNRNNNGFGDGMGAWWIIIFIIFAFVGFGNRGWGNGNGNGSTGSGALDNYVLASDFATLQRQLSDGFNDLTSQSRYIQNGLCDGFYNQAQLINGVNTNIAGSTATLQNSLCQGFNSVNQGIVTNGYETRNAISDVGYRLQDCCCQTQRSIDGVNFNMAQNTCAITTGANNNTRDIIDAINTSYNNLHNEITANRIEDKNAQIAAQQNEINALRLSASQATQNQFLLDQLKPCASPAYIVPNPNCCYNYNVTGGCNGCGTY